MKAKTMIRLQRHAHPAQLPKCRHCGGTLRLEEDEYWAELVCWNCERVYAHTPIPEINEIEEDDEH